MKEGRTAHHSLESSMHLWEQINCFSDGYFILTHHRENNTWYSSSTSKFPTSRWSRTYEKLSDCSGKIFDHTILMRPILIESHNNLEFWFYPLLTHWLLHSMRQKVSSKKLTHWFLHSMRPEAGGAKDNAQLVLILEGKEAKSHRTWTQILINLYKIWRYMRPCLLL